MSRKGVNSPKDQRWREGCATAVLSLRGHEKMEEPSLGLNTVDLSLVPARPLACRIYTINTRGTHSRPTQKTGWMRKMTLIPRNKQTNKQKKENDSFFSRHLVFLSPKKPLENSFFTASCSHLLLHKRGYTRPIHINGEWQLTETFHL